MTTIQVRIDEETKKSAKQVLDELGVDMSTAIKMYLKQIVLYQGIPLDLVTENGLTLRKELEILKTYEEAEAGVNLSEPMTGEEFLNELDRWKKIGTKKKQRRKR